MWKTFKEGIIENNPILVQLIGLCSVLAVSNTAINAFYMGIAVIFVLTLSNLFISAFRNLIPDKIRIPIFIVIIATFVTLVDMLLQAYVPEIHDQLGIFIPLIVVNCIILGRAEAFASENGVIESILDGLGTGVGYMFAIVALAIIREFFGAGAIFGIKIMPAFYKDIRVFQSAPGSFIVLGILIAIFRFFRMKSEERKEEAGERS